MMLLKYNLGYDCADTKCICWGSSKIKYRPFFIQNLTFKKINIDSAYARNIFPLSNEKYWNKPIFLGVVTNETFLKTVTEFLYTTYPTNAETNPSCLDVYMERPNLSKLSPKALVSNSLFSPSRSHRRHRGFWQIMYLFDETWLSQIPGRTQHHQSHPSSSQWNKVLSNISIFWKKTNFLVHWLRIFVSISIFSGCGSFDLIRYKSHAFFLSNFGYDSCVLPYASCTDHNSRCPFAEQTALAI